VRHEPRPSAGVPVSGRPGPLLHDFCAPSDTTRAGPRYHRIELNSRLGTVLLRGDGDSLSAESGTQLVPDATAVCADWRDLRHGPPSTGIFTRPAGSGIAVSASQEAMGFRTSANRISFARLRPVRNGAGAFPCHLPRPTRVRRRSRVVDAHREPLAVHGVLA